MRLSTICVYGPNKVVFSYCSSNMNKQKIQDLLRDFHVFQFIYITITIANQIVIRIEHCYKVSQLYIRQ